MDLLIPLTPKWFKFKKLYRSNQYFKEKLRETVKEDPRLKEQDYVFFQVYEKPFKLPSIHINGHVKNQKEKTLVEEIVKKESKNLFLLNNKLKIK